jgi:competence/damage-inducible protein CinA-like protein
MQGEATEGQSKVGIVTIGTELVRGERLDTNSAWLSDQLTELGLTCVLHRSCPDDLGAIVRALRQSVEEVGAGGVLLVTGGLGPTNDDLTRDAVAELLGSPLELHQPSLEHIQALYARFKRDMPDSNRRQALVPAGARVLATEVGTAPGFAAELDGVQIYVLPGPPREVRWFWDRHLSEPLTARGHSPGPAWAFRTVGIGESALAERLHALEASGVLVRYAAEDRLGTVAVTIHLPPTDPAAQAVRADLGRHLCAEGRGVTLADAVGALLIERDLRLATAESCTGGRVAAFLTGVPGISAVFDRGLVSYSNQSKQDLLGVPAELLEAQGAVCSEVAQAMARGARDRAGAAIGLGITGIAGPGGGTEDKPVGLVHFAVAGPGERLVALERLLPGDREQIQIRAAATALDLIRLAVQSAD